MTPCEKLGYKVGDKFEVIGCSNGHAFKLSSKVFLVDLNDKGISKFRGDYFDQLVPWCDVVLVSSSEQVDWSLDIITLISSVAPNVSVSDALEIASTLLEHGFKK